MVEGYLQSVLELLDVRPAVCVAKHAGEMLDGVGVVVCSVVGGIGGVLWYPVRGLMEASEGEAEVMDGGSSSEGSPLRSLEP